MSDACSASGSDTGSSSSEDTLWQSRDAPSAELHWIQEQEPSTAGIDLPTLLQYVNVPVSQSGRVGSGDAVVPEACQNNTKPDLSHSGLLRKALTESHLLHVVKHAKRITTKRPYDCRVLRALVEDPSKVKSPSSLKRFMHKGGFAEYRHWWVRVSNKPWKAAEPVAFKSWRALPLQAKYHWYIVKTAMAEVSRSHTTGCIRRRVSLVGSGEGTEVAESKDDVPVQEGSDVHALGILLTYFPTLGTDDPEVGAWVKQGRRGDDLRQALCTKSCYRAYFDAFTVFIQQLRDKLGFASCSTCMEMGDNARFPARVHCHAYIGFLKKDSTLTFAKQVCVPASELVFCNLKPYAVLTRGLRGRRLQDAVAQGMHYVAGSKASTLFKATDLEPIKDPVALLCNRGTANQLRALCTPNEGFRGHSS